MDFTIEQKAAITTALKQNTFINATAGAGKSTTLAEIAKRILAADPNNRVLLVTFTNKSAKDIISKVGESDKISGGTFHSIAYRMMRNNDVNFNICDTSKSNMIIKKLFDCKKDKKEFENIKSQISITKSDYPQRQCDYTDQYNAELAKYDMYDFDDIIFNGIEFIKDVEPIFSYTHVLVDELQDTSKAQLQLLIEMHKAYKVHMIGVGDLDQSIYEWRGARPENVNDFIKKFKCKEKPLGLNFRSKNNIVSKARHLIEHNISHKEMDIRSHDRNNGIVHSYRTGHPLSEIDYIVSLCRTNKRKNILILYRDRSNKMQLEYQLKKARLNYTVNDSTDIVDRSAFRVYIAMMKIAAKSYDIYDMEIVAKGIKALGTTSVALIKGLIDTNTTPTDDKGQTDLFTAASDDDTFHQKLSKLADANKKVKRGCIEMFKLQSEFAKMQKAEMKLDNIVTLFPDFMIKSYDVPAAIAEFLEDVTSDYDCDMNSIVELCNNFGLDGKEEVSNEDATITLSTIHGAKGGEEQMVIIPFCNWKFREDERVKDVEESERRLFYVAVTRAKEFLYLTYSGLLKPKFIKEMGL